MNAGPMVYPLPFGLVMAIHEAKKSITTTDIENAKAALELTNGNVPRAARILVDGKMTLAKAAAAIQAALGK